MLNSIKTTAIATLLGVVAATSAVAGSTTPGTTVGHWVNPDSGKSYLETFRGGELAQIEITGDGTSDVDLYVYDKSGNLIARSISYGHVEFVEFVPNATSEFEIRIENFGTTNGSYFDIWTN